jgi:hypothetical protein
VELAAHPAVRVDPPVGWVNSVGRARFVVLKPLEALPWAALAAEGLVARLTLAVLAGWLRLVSAVGVAQVVSVAPLGLMVGLIPAAVILPVPGEVADLARVIALVMALALGGVVVVLALDVAMVPALVMLAPAVGLALAAVLAPVVILILASWVTWLTVCPAASLLATAI